MTHAKLNGTQAAMVTSFIASAETNGVREFWVSDLKLARSLRVSQLRGGKLVHGEGKGVAVLCYGSDELGNTVALCRDGFVRCFYG